MPSKSSQHILGIDIGAGGIKLVELRNEQGRPRLVTYGVYENPLADVDSKNWVNNTSKTVSSIKALQERANSTATIAISALPTYEVFSALITVPPVAEKELKDAIRIEAKKVVPRPLEEMVLDWREIGTSEMVKKSLSSQGEGVITGSKGTKQRKILITAAPKDLVDKYLQIFKDANLSLHGLETEAIALSRSLIGKDPSVVMIVDMGAKTTNLSIIEQGIPVVNRGVKFGGILFTKAIAERSQITLERAEMFKRDVGISGEGQLSPSIKKILDDILHEIQYLFQLYRRQFQYADVSGTSIEKLVLTGGSAFVPGLADYLAEQLNVPVHLGDPWARIVYPEDLKPVLCEIGPAMAVAVGLAMQPLVR